MNKLVDILRLKVVLLKYKDIKKVVKLINKSKKFVMLIGVGVKYVKDELCEFIEMVKIFVIYLLLVKIILLDDYLYSIGNLGKIGIKIFY